MKAKKTKEEKIRVMVVDDHELMRSALRAIISAEGDFVLAAEVASGEAAIASVNQAKPDVVLMDGSMPGMNGIEASRGLRRLRPDLKIIGLTLYDQTTYLEEMIGVGASGYVLKTGSPSDIVTAIRVVAKGGTYFAPSIARQGQAASPEPRSTEKLSKEELEVAKLLAKGFTKSEIATSLGWSATEVEERRIAAMRKIGLRNRAELVRLATERGWLKN